MDPDFRALNFPSFQPEANVSDENDAQDHQEDDHGDGFWDHWLFPWNWILGSPRRENPPSRSPEGTAPVGGTGTPAPSGAPAPDVQGARSGVLAELKAAGFVVIKPKKKAKPAATATPAGTGSAGSPPSGEAK